MDVKIRQAKDEDANVVLSMVKALKTDDVSSRKNAWEKAFPRLVSSPDHLIVVAKIDGKIVGYVSATKILTFEVSRPFLMIDMLWVEPEHRYRGVGKALVSDCVDFAQREGCIQVAVISREEAKGFYEKLGMSEGRFTVFVKELHIT
ncbi:GNAT family N-acetyltransferase [bacterium]|nr:GNAT family N-acetyltransferase [bacterium]